MDSKTLRMATRLTLAWTTLLVSACATPPSNAERAPDTRLAVIDRNAAHPKVRELRPSEGALIATRAASAARSMVGAPYRYGGESPSGFDCSGLVHYAFGRAGAEVPRTSGALYRAAQPIPLARARTGDLVFFRLGDKLSHVGIYLDDGRFVHAPSTGKRVEIASLQSGWYERNFIRVGRLPIDHR